MYLLAILLNKASNYYPIYTNCKWLELEVVSEQISFVGSVLKLFWNRYLVLSCSSFILIRYINAFMKIIRFLCYIC